VALFKSDAPEKQVMTDYKKDCPWCHIPEKAGLNAHSVWIVDVRKPLV
jgi:hypothetical protein